MKKYILLLLATASIYGQAYQNPTYGKLKLKNNQTSTTATKVNVQETDGTINTKPLSELDNYLEFDSAVSMPVTGEQGKLYLTKDNNRLYRFNGTIYQELTTDISGKEDIANKQNSLAVYGSNIKYPTVTAVNAGLALKSNDNAVVHLTGAETITGVKSFTSLIKQGSGTFTFTVDGGNGAGPRLGLSSTPWGIYDFFEIGAFNSQNNFASKGRNFAILSTIGGVEDSRLKLIANTGNVIIQNGGTFTDDLTNRLQVTGTISSGTTALGNTPPIANNQLTRKDYVDTGLYVKENVANKQNSLAIDGTNTKYPTVTAVNAALSTKQNYLDWATPQDYGAIGDGIADDTAALQACLTNNSNVLLYGNYKTTDYLEVFSNQFIFSNNATITRSSTASAILVALDRENIQIKGALTLVGNGNFEGTNSGIKMSGVDNFKIDGVVFKNISGVGLWISAGSVSFPRGKGGLISNIQAINCYIGMQFDYGAQGEYHSVVNFNATECNTGANIYAGNISITGGNIVDNTLGIYLGGFLSSNNSHGILNGLQINHNALNLKIENAEFGETIQGCHFYGDVTNNIEIINSKGISFNNCIIDGLVSVTGVGTHVVSNTQIESQTSFTGSKINIIDCFTKDGGMYIGNGYDIKGVNHAVGLGYNDFGNIHIYTDGELSINKGGSLSLGGVYNSTGGIASFAKIHGKSETSTTGSLAGYMAFEVSNNSTSPYSREVGRFSSTGNFTVLGTVTATSYTATSLPVFENNAAASSLAVGQFYRTSIGVLMVKF